MDETTLTTQNPKLNKIDKDGSNSVKALAKKPKNASIIKRRIR